MEAIAQKPQKREAYATVLHSSKSYVWCNRLSPQLQTRTHRDLILLLDPSFSNPPAKLSPGPAHRLRQDHLHRLRRRRFHQPRHPLPLPQMSAGNDGSIFNSGVMVIKPSNCTFRMLMDRRKDIVSYNGGDQGFLNEVFVWWHRLPRRVNFLKNFWSNSSIEASVKNQLLGSDPPKLYSLHYLGFKPWQCYRDYDCNWDVADQRVYASDAAHERWWKVHDAMEEGLQRFCGLSEERKIEVEWGRKMAREMGFRDQHWRINVTDPRKFI
ncbi:UDP-glucuronate:xylan alpha-glucuronosyltransferase 2 [Sesamum alatum]|uniref:UDP-glucuronate:xylan alpha-glucuronosyltransferase 2 n=1 Tax=Sesamum alatum TaxID=300844 RepID=A0AAE1XP70_9LAMI|nr:UDP-glucuronate:xylan alpha-glucuronosyltransferase 2 [Sesamum alatum]